MPMPLLDVIDVIASRGRLMRPNCRNAVIVRMRAGDLGVMSAFRKNNFEELCTSKGSGTLVAGGLLSTKTLQAPQRLPAIGGA
jgi:hypothetical protein